MIDYLFIVPAFFLSLVMVFGGMIASWLLAPRKALAGKKDPYECGEKTIGPSWLQFNVGYYLFGLVFLVFDVEVAFFFPWALVLREIGPAALLEGVIFIGVLAFGLLYAWKKGALEWV